MMIIQPYRQYILQLLGKKTIKHGVSTASKIETVSNIPE
jgi:hypothetical protein